MSHMVIRLGRKCRWRCDRWDAIDEAQLQGEMPLLIERYAHQIMVPPLALVAQQGRPEQTAGADGETNALIRALYRLTLPPIHLGQRTVRASPKKGTKVQVLCCGAAQPAEGREKA